MGTQHVRVGDIEVCYALDGPADAPVLMLIHGILTTHRMWDGLVSDLAGQWRILRYDLRGHGGTDATRGPYKMDQLLEDAIGLLDALDVDRVHCVGSSLGGMIGQRMGASQGARLFTLTLANTTAVQNGPLTWQQRIDTAGRHGVPALVEPTLARWFTPKFLESDGTAVHLMRSLAVDTSAEGFAGCAAAVRDLGHLHLLPQIRVPTLVVVGEHDHATPPEEGRQLQQQVPGAQLVSLPAAHQAAVECPGEFAALWRAFVLNANPP